MQETKQSLESLEWRDSRIGDIFVLTRGKRHIEIDRKKGKIPYYSASSINNGLTDTISNPLFTTKDKLIISTFCDAYFVCGEFTASDEITICDNPNVNLYNGLFIAQIIKNNASKYAFGRKAFMERLQKQILLLPTDSKGQPHWEFMESFMKELEQKKIQKILDYYNKTYSTNNGGGGGNILSAFNRTHYKTSESKLPYLSKDAAKQSFLEGSLMEIAKHELALESLQWREFRISDIFDKIEKGKCKNFNKETNESTKGVSFLSATINNNGVSAFVESNHLLQKGNCIMFINQGDGGAGYAVYKYEDFIATTSCSFGYAKWINKYTGLFVASILCRFKEKYSFGYGRTEARLKNDILLLPTDSKGNPNWEFMESFMKELESKHLTKILAYYNHKAHANNGGGGGQQQPLIIRNIWILSTLHWLKILKIPKQRIKTLNNPYHISRVA